jgi:hypothetical protein
MKKIIFISILFSVVLLHASIITVDNNPGSIGDYATLQDAHDVATDGDTIYVLPSVTPYSAISVTKILSLYGVGFDLIENPGNQASVITSKISGEMNFQNGSQYSKIEGFDGDFSINIVCSNITVKKNELDKVSISSNDIYNIVILQNRIYCPTSSNHDSIFTNSSYTEVYLLNNIIKVSNSTYHYAIRFHVSALYNNWTIYNNIIEGQHAIYTYNSNTIDFCNNITIYGICNLNIFSNESYICHNMCNENQLPDGNGNIENVDMNTVFVNPNGDYHLLPTSPAIGSGENGVDMGIYGGETPYVDGGIPGLPSIFEINSSFVGSQQSGLDVEIKAKSNEE